MLWPFDRIKSRTTCFPDSWYRKTDVDLVRLHGSSIKIWLICVPQTYPMAFRSDAAARKFILWPHLKLVGQLFGDVALGIAYMKNDLLG